MKNTQHPRISLVWLVVSTAGDEDSVLHVHRTERQAKRALGLAPGWRAARLEARFAIIEGKHAHLFATEMHPLCKSTR